MRPSASVRLATLIVLTLATAARGVLAAPATTIAQMKHTRWTVDDGAPAGIRALAQTPNGYLWIGAQEGLFRFDGVRFEAIAGLSEDKSRDASVTALLVTRSGDLWIGYESGRVGILHDGRTTEVTPPEHRWWVVKFVEAADGAIWMQTATTNYQLARFADGKWTHIGRGWGVDEDRLADLLATRDGAVWVVTTLGERVLKLQPHARSFQEVAAPRAFSASLAEDAQGRVWVSDYQTGTYPLQPIRGAAGPIPEVPALALSKRRIMFDRQGAIWGRTTASGIFRIAFPNLSRPGGAPGREDLFTAREGLSSDAVTALIEDREGDIWTASPIGIDRFRAAAVALEPGIPARSRRGYVLLADRRGTVWASDADNVSRILPTGSPQIVISQVNNPEALCEARDGAVWLGSHDNLYRLAGDRFLATVKPPRPVNYLNCAADGEGNLWFTLVGGDFFRLEASGHWQEVVLPKRDADELPTAVGTDATGHFLFYVRLQGLMRWENGKVRLIQPFYRMPSGHITILYRAGNSILIGTDAGLGRLRDDTVEGLPNGYDWLRGVVGIVQTPRGETWIHARAGLIKLMTRDLERAFRDPSFVLSPRIFDHRDGLAGSPIFADAKNSLALGADGRIWCVTTEGVFRIDPTHLPANLVAPPVAITALAAAGQRWRDPRTPALRAGVSRLEIDYTANSLMLPERVRFLYRLNGVDQGWIDPRARRQAFYTNLRPGDYRFQVIAANNDGVWNRRGATLDFRIPPTFLQSRVFRVLCAVALVLLLGLLYTLRLRQVTARMRARLHERLAERERIARELHDTLLQGFQGLVLRFQAIAERVPAGQPERALIEDALDRADLVLVEARDRVRQLRLAGDPDDLANLLASAADEFAGGPGPRFRLVVEGTPRELHPVVLDETARIGAEAIRNAFAHANASAIEAAILYLASGLQLSVRDDGIGLAADVASRGGREGHFGLIGMRERAARIQGTLTVCSRPGAGTEVVLTVAGRISYAKHRQGATARIRAAKLEHA